MKPHIVGRLHAQGLGAPRFDSADEVVRHLGAVQSQLHDMASWAVARRTRGLTFSDVGASFARGDFLRTHVLRPTWHFVDPADIHWLLSLTAPRIIGLMASSNASIGLTETVLERGVDVISRAVTSHPVSHDLPLTRAEIGEHLAGAGLPHRGQALAHLVMRAEIDAHIVNGPMRGKQHTYVPLPPTPVSLPREELLSRAATRYATGHGPFRDRDLSWWTSLTLTDSRRAITRAGLRPLAVDGQTYWHLDNPVEVDVPPVMLLPSFDEYISFARDPGDYDRFGGQVEDVSRGGGLLMLDGRLAGTWKRTVKTTTVDITVCTTARTTASLRRGIQAEADSFGLFLGREPVLDLTT